MRLASTADGLRFTDLGAAEGLMDAKTLFIDPRGTVIATATGHGFFFSAGVEADADSDAFHYIGYAESPDLRHWTVINGLPNPLLSRDPSDPSGGPPSWYAGRVYSPAVTLSPDGQTATLVFAGYHTPKPKDDLGNYRTIGVVTLVRATMPGLPSTGAGGTQPGHASLRARVGLPLLAGLMLVLGARWHLVRRVRPG